MILFNCSLVVILITIQVTHSINLGLIAGDLKRTGAPIIIRKYSRHNPIIINIRGSRKTPTIPRLKPPKPPPTRFRRALRLPLLTKPLPFILPPILPLIPPLLLPPLLPKIPILPIMPILAPKLPIISPKLTFLQPSPKLHLLAPKLPLLSPKFCPLATKIPRSLRLLKAKLNKPVKPFSLLKKPVRLTALGSESKLIKVPLPGSKHYDAMNLLRDIRTRGGLTSAEYYKLKKLLFR